MHSYDADGSGGGRKGEGGLVCGECACGVLQLHWLSILTRFITFPSAVQHNSTWYLVPDLRQYEVKTNGKIAPRVLGTRSLGQQKHTDSEAVGTGGGLESANAFLPGGLVGELPRKGAV